MSSFIHVRLQDNRLPAQDIAEMWTLYKPFYHYSYENFVERISRNTHYAIYRQYGRIVGFTGLRLEKVTVANQRFFTVYFGQTVVAPEARGKGLILRTGLVLLRRYCATLLTHKLVFWADALSYRAYLVFAKNLIEYYPNVEEELPIAIRQLRDHLGTTNYKGAYCPERGTVCKHKFLVQDPRMIIHKNDLGDADVAFFAKANPYYLEGCGLLTIGPASLKNIIYMIKRARQKEAYPAPKTQPTLQPQL